MRRPRDETPGALIRAHREAKGLTQRQLAQAAGVSIGVVRDLEQGLTGRPRAATVQRLAAALELNEARAAQLLAARPRATRTAGPRRGFGAVAPAGLRISVLGPLTVWRDGRCVPLGPEAQRAVLGLLALHANAAVHREALIDALWSSEPPPTAVAMIQSYVSRLRRLLGPAGDQPLISTGTSYRLALADGELDAAEFGQLTARAREAVATGGSALACHLYAQALTLWQGDPLADVRTLAAHPAVLDLGHQRADAVLTYADTAFLAGQPDQVVRPLRGLYHREPLNERVAARLMIALAGTGCQAEALNVYDEVRQRLDDQLGVYPCAELARTQAMVLRQQVPTAAVAGAPLAPRAARHRPVPLSLLPGGAGRS